MKDIILKIKNDEGIEFTTEGRMYSKGASTLIQYEESELSGMAGCTTSLTITPKRVRMKRKGEGMADTTEMIFEKGKRLHGIYATPYGNFPMEILTNEISGLTVPKDGNGRLSIDYSLNLKGLLDTRKTLDIQYVDRNAPIDLANLDDDQVAASPAEKALEAIFKKAMLEIERRELEISDSEAANDVTKKN